jgi:hypothetical protein
MKHGKNVENRTWATNFRGRILIHASKKPAVNTIQILKNYNVPVTEDELKEIAERCGYIIGSVELVDCVRGHCSPWAEPGLWHWVLKNPVMLDHPLPAKGRLGLWEYK